MTAGNGAKNDKKTEAPAAMPVSTQLDAAKTISEI